MPAVGLLPSLSQVQTIATELLRQAACSWRATGAHWEQVFTRLREQASRDDMLEGQTGAAVCDRACDDWVIVQGKVFALQEAAQIAELGADRLAGAQAHVLDAVEQTRAAGFAVNEDLSVTDTQAGGSPARRAARLAQAETHAAYIRHCVSSLVAVDREVSAQLAAATQGFATVAFDESPIPGIDDEHAGQEGNHTGVQLAGYGTPLPEEPPPSDPGLPHQPPGGFSEDPGTRDAQKIAYGHAWQDHWKDVPGMTQERLAQLVHDMMTGNPKTDPDLYVGQTSRGSTVIYKDGTMVIYDHKAWDRGTVFKPDHGFDDFLRLTKPGGLDTKTPIISQPPQLPPVLDHPLPAPLPLDTGHPPVMVPPTRFVDPATLPPWLKDPSPPGFRLTPSQPPTIFAWDVPDPPSAHGGPATAPGPGGPAITWPASQDAAKAGAGVLAVVGGLLGLLAHPGSPLTPMP
jgi:hypothetical protein